MPKYPDIEYSSRKILPGPVKDNRPHLVLANPRFQAYNETIFRFDPKQWVVDYNALMVATIIPIGSRSFKVPAQWRTNSDFLGVRWISKDDYNHHYFKYQTKNDYTGMILAFRANPSEPNKFTITVVDGDNPYTYRLSPYALDETTGRYECLDTKYGTKNSYPASIIQAAEFDIPEDEMEEFEGRKDYIYILDFGDLRTQSSYTGPRVSQKNITMLSFDCVEASHGLGKNAYCAAMNQLPNNEIEMELGGVYTNAVLTAGDKLQMIWRYYDPNTMVESFTESEFVVKRYSGFGSSALKVIVEGTMPGVFAGCDAFFGRYLATGVPGGVTNSTKYFCDFTMTGGDQTIGKRNYAQPVNGQGMTSGFDDGYNLTPERQVEMTYALGYRDWWTTYIGMSHYFSARTAFQHKVTGEKILKSEVLTFPVLFAGAANASVHFTAGKYPNRGMDGYIKKLTDLYGVGYGAPEVFDGAVGSTAADRMSSPNPDSEVFDPTQTKGGGGLWWWDLEQDKPGPALLNAVDMLEGRTPRVIIWNQGEQDAAAIAFPGTRVPVPTVARTKLATQKVFAYFRQLWGATLPILVQELGYGWGLPIASQPSVPIQKGQPTYLDVTRNSWGDVVFTWLSYGDDPKNYNYRVEIYDPKFPTQLMRTITVPGTQINDKGLIFCDYPSEMNVADAISVYGEQYPWSFLRWRVVRTDSNLVVSQTVEMTVPEDNNAFVKKVIVCGINSLIGGYFNDLSDPLKPGGTGNPGRRDVVAAATLRQTFAANAGLRPVEVLPVMTVVGSSPINPMPYQENFPLDNYWWNPDTNQPGPNLIIADEIVKAIGRAPDYFIESGPGETTGIAYAPEAQWPSIIAAWKNSNVRMLQWMRANWGNAGLEIWFQGATTSWWGVAAPPTEVNWKGTHELRTAQVDMATNYAGFKLGSYVPNAGDWRTYRNEMADGLGWVHYSVQGYHDAAREMGEALARNINRALLAPPLWTTLRPPTNLKVRRQVNNAILMTWDGRPESQAFKASNYHAQDVSLLSEETVTESRWVFSVLNQIQVYNQLAAYIIFDAGEYLPNEKVDGPKVRWEAFAMDGDPDFNPLTTMVVEFIGPPVEIPQGGGALYPRDIRVRWTAPADGLTYWVKNIRADVEAANIASLEVSGNQYIFTIAEQLAQYGFGASFVNFEVAKYDPVNQIRGPVSKFAGLVTNHT